MRANHYIGAGLVLLLGIGAKLYLGSYPPPPSGASLGAAIHASSGPSVPQTQPTKTAGCVASAGLPDPGCTPGAIITTATKEAICVSGYSKSVRNVTGTDKHNVYAEYGITSHRPNEYEVDHLISLELGGSNDLANLWPEAAAPTPGFHEKDMVENFLHAQVCNGSMTLSQAQSAISSNWLTVYNSLPNPGQYRGN